MTKIAIIGSGPAGLSAALYTTRAGVETVVYGGEYFGGLPTTTEKVDNYLGMPGVEGLDMAKVFLDHAERLGAELRRATAHAIAKTSDHHYSVVDTDGNAEEFDAVIYAAGSKPKKLGIPGEELSGVSWCATCDGSFFQGDPVAVVGGGESAIEEAVYMSELASNVTLLVRGDSFRASDAVVDHLRSKPNVEIRFNTEILEARGDDGLLSSILLSDGSELEVYGLFETIGQVPQSQLAVPHALLHDNGFIHRAETEGFFIAGDITNPEYRQIAVAVGDGAKAGIDAIRWLQNRHS